ncbi:MAG: glycoside hydrolase family 3 C-terminal domain-containing protein, partial [Bacteroidota bacterium]
VRGADFATTLSRASVTVVRPGPIPLGSQRVTLVQMSNSRSAGSLTRLERDLGAATNVRVTRQGGGRDRAVRAARNADVAVVAVHLRVLQATVPQLSRSQRRTVEAIAATGTPVVLVVVGNPYAAALLPEAAGVVVAYDQTARTASAVADVLRGRHTASGRLPVEIPGL